MYDLVDLPGWLHDIIAARAKAAGMTFDEALVASLDIRVADPLAESLGWAAARGVPTRTIARRTHYSRSSVSDSARRYRALSR